jgi:hypothetical protein
VEVEVPLSVNSNDVLDLLVTFFFFFFFYFHRPFWKQKSQDLGVELLWSEFSLCVSSSAIHADATDGQAAAFRAKRKVLKLRETKPLSHYRRILENSVCVNLVENSALGQPGAHEAAAASSPVAVAKKALPAMPEMCVCLLFNNGFCVTNPFLVLRLQRSLYPRGKKLLVVRMI